MGAHVDDISVKLYSDVERTKGRNAWRSVAVAVCGRVSDMSGAIRVGNHRPNKDVAMSEQTTTRVFRDVQASLGEVSVLEVVNFGTALNEAHRRFGALSALSDNSLYGTLLCLDDADLLSVMAALDIPSLLPSSVTPSPMLTWQLTNQIAKAFRAEKSSASSTASELRDVRTTSAAHTVTIPLLTTRDSARELTARPVPFVALYTRNYGDSSDHQRVVAASIESVDVALTASSVYCVASLLDVGRFRSKSTPVVVVDNDVHQSPVEGRSRDSSANASAVNDTTPRHDVASLDAIQVSIITGHVRLILPSDELSDVLATRQPRCRGNVTLALESATVLSATWSDISLDGLGYPPFNATKLPRRQRPPTQHLGDSKHRLWCKTGKIYGVVSEFVRVSGAYRSDELSASGPFTDVLSQQLDGDRVVARESEAFLLPFSVAVDVEERSDSGQRQRRTALALTKVRLEVSKQSYDDIVHRVTSSLCALQCLLRSPLSRQKRKPRPPYEDVLQQPVRSSLSVTYELSSDGTEVVLSSTAASVHVRVGSVIVQHNSVDDTGSFSVQNVVVGFRSANEQGRRVAETTSREELVFGAFADPGRWQLDTASYPEKLLSGRWHALEDTHERVLFLDMHAYQLHVSAHVLQHVRAFFQWQPSSLFRSRRSDRSVASTVTVMERAQYAPRRKTNVKVLVAPSVLSFWERASLRNERWELATCVWVTCGQVFASVGLGRAMTATSDSRRQLLSASFDSDSVHELNRFVSVREAEFMLNLETVSVKASTAFPVLGIEFGSGTAGSLPSHIASSWMRFAKHVRSGSAKLRLVEECTVRVTGDVNQIVERVVATDGAVAGLETTTMARVNLQGEISAVDVKISSHSIEAVTSLLTAVQRVTRASSTPAARVPPPPLATPQLSSFVSRTTTTDDDFSHLRRVAEARHPSPGELVLAESLFIETGSATEALLQAREADTVVQIDDRIAFARHDDDEPIDEDDVLAFIEEVNVPWEHENVDASLSVFENRTMSWMGMRWCYHLPRTIDAIVATPVPVPPTGLPSGWPVWRGPSGDSQSRRSGRRCDLFCQLRCWDYQSNRFVIVSEFFVPWERSASSSSSHRETDAPESFGDFVTQWFEDDDRDANHADDSTLLELASATRRLRFSGGPPSDKWELRWRSPLSVDKEAEVRLLAFVLCVLSGRLD